MYPLSPAETLAALWAGPSTANDARRYRLAVAVVRPELLDAAMARWPWASCIYDKDLP